MTDLETFTAMLTRASVPHEVETDFDTGEPRVVVNNWQHKSRTYETHGIDGYCGFYSTWTFDAAGKLVSVGHWE